MEPRTLWQRLMDASEHARTVGALQPMTTRSEFVEQAGVSFSIRVLSATGRKERATVAQRRQQLDPFLPYERDLFVADVSPTHVALLNKFNVLDHHLLVVTRDYEDQETWLSCDDFQALWRCMAEFEALGFYNAGRIAGASQPHKHLQLVPLPLTDGTAPVPMAPLLSPWQWQAEVAFAPALPFAHALAPVGPEWLADPAQGARESLAVYASMLRAVGLLGADARLVPGAAQSRPYNLLVTRQWMLLVPRGQECFDGITVNALGFAGAFLAHNEAELACLRRHGPLTALQAVAAARLSAVGADPPLT